jgi:hypothetical protein
VSAKIDGEDGEPLEARFPAEGVVPGSPAAGAMADHQPGGGKTIGRIGNVQGRRKFEIGRQPRGAGGE